MNAPPSAPNPQVNQVLLWRASEQRERPRRAREHKDSHRVRAEVGVKGESGAREVD